MNLLMADLQELFYISLLSLGHQSHQLCMLSGPDTIAGILSRITFGGFQLLSQLGAFLAFLQVYDTDISSQKFPLGQLRISRCCTSGGTE